ncbi:unnamed protein product [Urochloa humidicola]
MGGTAAGGGRAREWVEQMRARGWAERQPAAVVRARGVWQSRCDPFFLIAGNRFFLMTGGPFYLRPPDRQPSPARCGRRRRISAGSPPRMKRAAFSGEVWAARGAPPWKWPSPASAAASVAAVRIKCHDRSSFRQGACNGNGHCQRNQRKPTAGGDPTTGRPNTRRPRRFLPSCNLCFDPSHQLW